MLTDLPPEVAGWRDAIQRLSPSVPPCRYLSPARWGTMRDNALDFLDRFGAEAHRLGWTASELFGVHPENGTLRVDWCGVLMVSGDKAASISANRIAFTRTAGYRDTPGMPRGMPIWEFSDKRKAAA
ncbi:hypothetical protein [Methylobacterium thuringiense]|uniref:Uncharacterized protein n=1 Tax=Methylobacterium thuringiense TaxID=1003091 RepID=A0ABQ4TSL2_9HYPH|nr:hypothetical protein [Methylobacterium thuringiense]GJE57394.1 hypothetical protein EKPJFOCH_3908 [Methylobacterium thuringiense]